MGRPHELRASLAYLDDRDGVGPDVRNQRLSQERKNAASRSRFRSETCKPGKDVEAALVGHTWMVGTCSSLSRRGISAKSLCTDPVTLRDLVVRVGATVALRMTLAPQLGAAGLFLHGYAVAARRSDLIPDRN